jgi:hypothetical protein
LLNVPALLSKTCPVSVITAFTWQTIIFRPEIVIENYIGFEVLVVVSEEYNFLDWNSM